MALPLVADLLETCVNDVIHTPVPMATAGLSASASSLTGEEKVSLAETAARLKHLELHSLSLPVPSRANLNMNNQEDVVKLTEKCLNSVGSSSVPSPLRPPEDLKRNIIKAQAQAALKVLNTSVRVLQYFQERFKAGSTDQDRVGKSMGEVRNSSLVVHFRTDLHVSAHKLS